MPLLLYKTSRCHHVVNNLGISLHHIGPACQLCPISKDSSKVGAQFLEQRFSTFFNLWTLKDSLPETGLSAQPMKIYWQWACWFCLTFVVPIEGVLEPTGVCKHTRLEKTVLGQHVSHKEIYGFSWVFLAETCNFLLHKRSHQS